MLNFIKTIFLIIVGLVSVLMWVLIVYIIYAMFAKELFPGLDTTSQYVLSIILVSFGLYITNNIYDLGERKNKKNDTAIINNSSQIQKSNATANLGAPVIKNIIVPLGMHQQTLTSATPKPVVNKTEAERAQERLDNYWKKKKSKEEIGKDYERFIGWTYEDTGYKVRYNGIQRKLEDGGIDLICRRGNEIIIVQCKNWAKDKTVHEKHINQLYGAFQAYKIENNIDDSYDPKAVFVTSAFASETARKIASYLEVDLIEEFYMDTTYPCIKCNISGSREKIYHLPFDGLYDRTMITKKGECYVKTVKEAENRGFRRAN